MLKDFTLSLELEPTENRVVQTAAIFWSHDVNTAKIYIELLRKGTPIILNKDVTVRVMMLFDDENKSEHIYTTKIEDELKGLVSITLEESMRMYVGQVTCGVYVDYQNEEKTDNGYFTFGMRRSLIDKDMPELQKLYVSDFEKALEDIKEFKVNIDKNIEDMQEHFDNEYNKTNNKVTGLNSELQKLEDEIKSTNVAKKEDLNNLEKSVNDELKEIKENVPVQKNIVKYQTTDMKALVKVNDKTYNVITQKGDTYVEMQLRKDVIDTSNVSLGGEGQVYRLVSVREVSDAFVYKQPAFRSSQVDGINDFAVETLVTGYNYPEKSPYITNSARGKNGSYLIFNHVIKPSDKGMLSLAFFSTPNSCNKITATIDDVEIGVINTQTKDNIRGVFPYFLSVGNRLGEVEIKLKIEPKEAHMPAHFLGVSATDFNTMSNNDKCNSILYNYSENNYITRSKGANDYAIQNEQGKWMGSYHGGETLEEILITIDGHKEKLSVGEVEFGSNITFYQKTIIGGLIRNLYRLNFSKPATIENSNVFKVIKPFSTNRFHVAMTCTNPEFDKIIFPVLEKSIVGKTVYLDNVGEVVQINDNNGLTITSNHSIMKEYNSEPLYVESSIYYNKVYHNITVNKRYDVKDVYFSSSKTFN